MNGIGDIANRIAENRSTSPDVVIVAIDGRSGVGKSTFAAALAKATDAAVIDGDAFYAGGIVIRDDSAAELAFACIDWPKQRAVLEQLKAGKPTRYRPFDWEAFDGSLEVRSVLIEPKQIVILEGVYSARLEFSDLLDMRILLQAADDVRLQRLLALLWQIYSRCCFSLICLLQYGHRCGRGRTMSSTMAWRTAGRLG